MVYRDIYVPNGIPEDRANFLGLVKRKYPNGSLVTLRLTNQSASITGIGVEPFGNFDDFPLGTTYEILMWNIHDIVIEEQDLEYTVTSSTPSDIDWPMCLMYFSSNGNLILASGDAVSVFKLDGTGTFAYGSY